MGRLNKKAGLLTLGLCLIGLAVWLAFAKSKAEFLRETPGAANAAERTE